MDSDTATAPVARDWATKFGIKAYRYRALLKRRWWILAVAVCIGLAIEACILIRQPVTFESTGSLVVGGSLEVSGGSRYSEDQDGFYVTQIKILQSPAVQDRAQRRLAITDPQLNGKVDILATVVPRSKIVSVVGLGTNPDYTQHFVQALMEEYLSYRNEQKNSVATKTIQGITDELANTRKELDRQRSALQDFSEKNNMAFWKEQQKGSVDMLTSLKRQQALRLTELQQLQNMSSDQLLNHPITSTSAVKTGDDPQAANSDDGNSGSSSDLGVQYFQASQELAQKQAELEEKSKVWRPKHPGIKKIRDEIDRLQLLIKTIKSQNKESTQARIEATKAELKSLDASIEIWDKKVLEASRKDAQYQTLQSAVTTTQSLYEKLVESIQGVNPAAISTDMVSIMEQATPPKQVPPGFVKHLLIGLILGTIAGGAILFLIDRADDRISSSTELIEYFSEPILGQIPNVETSRVETGLPLLQHDDERYSFAESFRSLRSSLIFMPNQGELKTLVVTSSIPGEGKSTIASNLAITMALAGARVLLVDADLRRGDIASLFDVDGRLGLSSVLRGEVEWKAAVQKSKHHPTLTLLPRGPVTNQSGELLLVPAFEPMLRDFKNEFDLTIFNTSPILATDDTATIAPNFDGTLMVIRAQFTGAHLAHNSLNALYQRQVNVLGIILNCVDTEMPDYYYYRYPKYYTV